MCLLFMIMYVLSLLIILMMNDWFMLWMGLEMNLFSFILLMYKNKSCDSIESCLKYFIVQASGSGVLLGLMYYENVNISVVGLLILMFKMGAGVFYFWFPSVCVGLGWIACFLLFSIQKVIPLMLMNVFVLMGWMLWFMSGFSIIIGVYGSFNQKELSSLLAYSSIHHIGWMLLCQIVDSSLWLFYLIVYTLMIFPVIWVLMNLSINDLILIYKWENKWIFILLVLGMGGMPPFIGFFLKWMSFYFIKSMGIGMIFFMIVMSVSMFYIYLRILYDLMLGSSVKLSWDKGLVVYSYKIKLDLYILVGSILSMLMCMSVMF